MHEACWHVPCPVKTCQARVGERCKTADGHTHKRRIKRWEAPVVERVYVTWFESNRGRH